MTRRKILRKKRGQVFIMATLLMVVYGISMIAVVTELAVNRHQQDEIKFWEELEKQIQTKYSLS